MDIFKLRYVEDNKLWDVLVFDNRGNRCLLLQSINDKNESKFVVNYDESNFLQSTGLKDKNGELIYEGDIIQFPNPFEENKCFRQVVNWTLIAFGVGFDVTHQKAELSEVIGNIYENKELLDDIH